MIIHVKCREEQWESHTRNRGWQSFLGSRTGGAKHSYTGISVSIKIRGKGKKGERGEGKGRREGGLGRKDEGAGKR